MTDGASDRETYDRVADALGEALRTLAHDAANCAAVFDMEVSELGAHDATGVGDSLRAATERLKLHVGDLRSLAASRRDGDAALDEALALVLRLLSRSAKRDLTRIAGERVQARVRAPHTLVVLTTLVMVREVIAKTETRGPLTASVTLDGEMGTIDLTVAMQAADVASLTDIVARAVGSSGRASSGVLDGGAAPPTHRIKMSFPLS